MVERKPSYQDLHVLYLAANFRFMYVFFLLQHRPIPLFRRIQWTEARYANDTPVNR